MGLGEMGGSGNPLERRGHADVLLDFDPQHRWNEVVLLAEGFDEPPGDVPGEKFRRRILDGKEDAVAAREAPLAVLVMHPHLGIILLLAPLSILERGEPARIQLQQLLAELTVDDAECVYRAIRLANPGGLGDAPEQDVRFEPTVTLLEAMNLAADRDMIARQYANGYADVFDFGVPAFLEGFEKFGNVEAAIVDSQLRWLAAFPDSLISRKNGPSVAEDVRSRASEVQKLGGIATPEGRRAGVALDEYLRSDGNKLNPGTTADLIAACVFVALREGNVRPSSPFRWDTDEWL